MTDNYLNEIRERNEKRKALKAAATYGPWFLDVDQGGIYDICYGTEGDPADTYSLLDSYSIADYAFVVAARNDTVEADVDALLAEMQALRQQITHYTTAKSPQEYQGVSWCDNCDEEAKHIFHDSGHERDSSGDWRQCLKCRWTWLGLTGKYEPPSE